MEKDYAAFGAWLVKGGDGWLAMLERFDAQGHKLTGASICELKTLAARLKSLLEQQEAKCHQ